MYWSKRPSDQECPLLSTWIIKCMNHTAWTASQNVWAGCSGTRRQAWAILLSSFFLVTDYSTAASDSARSAYRLAKWTTASQITVTAFKKGAERAWGGAGR